MKSGEGKKTFLFVLLCLLNLAAKAEERSENVIHRKKLHLWFLIRQCYNRLEEKENRL